VGDAADHRPERRARVRARPDRPAVAVNHPHDRLARLVRREQHAIVRGELEVPARGGLQLDPVHELADARAQVVVEAGDDAPFRHGAHDDREQAQDREGERGAQHRDLQLDRQAGPHGSLST
jgi:hypothetical protein